MNSGYLVHVFAIITLALGVWIFADKFSGDGGDEVSGELLSVQKDSVATDHFRGQAGPGSSDDTSGQALNDVTGNRDVGKNVVHSVDANEDGNGRHKNVITPENINPEEALQQYLLAWNNQNKTELDRLWEQIKACEKCLQLMVDQIVNRSLEEGLILELAIKMAALDTDIVLPVFDSLIDPAGSKSTAIILSEKLINNGRPEFVAKIFDLIYRARQSGHENFAQQLTWVISKLENPQGIEPVLDMITGRKYTSPELATHITSVYSKVVRIIPEESDAGAVIANYYLQANDLEKQKLWPVVRQHGATLVTLALDADSNGQNNNVQKYAQAMTELPHLESVTSLMQLHTAIEYSPVYMKDMLSKRVVDNPTIKVLHKLEDYMRNPLVKMESRFFAAEGLLAVRQNRQARYILEKVIKSTHEPDAELQAFIAGRL